MLVTTLDWKGWFSPVISILTLLISSLILWIVVATPLALEYQILFGLISYGVIRCLLSNKHRIVTILLMWFSIAISTRYIYWRITTTLPDTGTLDILCGDILLFAELYAWLVLALGYFQMVWPLGRKPVALPNDQTHWPTVDIFIPTYDEPLSVVKPTVMAALQLDWPQDKYKVYILDDGARDEFRDFSEAIGVTHLTRPSSEHAKAGNINTALLKTGGEFVAIFDCDHTPSRSFLQLTMGWFLKDPKLAMMQTPHHFFSPDPFERNSGTFKTVPNEGKLFYGTIQDGNDLWNATFFCGSCAVIRRAPLMEVGGIAVETVTEDAHTALKLNRLDYYTAYMKVPQAAGLATESMSAHIGQRIRWARGMAQIFRIDNPLLGKGLHWYQRLCYSGAMLHFFFGLPRLIFLVAPLSYLFFEAHVISASAAMIAAYALPHLMASTLLNNRVQGKFRHSFWAEVYETSLATYLIPPTLLALINPKFGTFNVTAKGGLIEKEYFDAKISQPYLILMALNLAGFALGLIRLLWWNQEETQTVILNLLWTLYNLMIIGATLGVSWETRQRRRNHRIQMQLPAAIRLNSGQTLACQTDDLSATGIRVDRLPYSDSRINTHDEVQIIIMDGYRELIVPATLVHCQDRSMGFNFLPLTFEQEQALYRTLYMRADTWLRWEEGYEPDQPGRSMRRLFHLSTRGIHRTGRWSYKHLKGRLGSIKPR